MDPCKLTGIDVARVPAGIVVLAGVVAVPSRGLAQGASHLCCSTYLGRLYRTDTTHQHEYTAKDHEECIHLLHYSTIRRFLDSDQRA